MGVRLQHTHAHTAVATEALRAISPLIFCCSAWPGEDNPIDLEAESEPEGGEDNAEEGGEEGDDEGSGEEWQAAEWQAEKWQDEHEDDHAGSEPPRSQDDGGCLHQKEPPAPDPAPGAAARGEPPCDTPATVAGWEGALCPTALSSAATR